MRAHEVVRRPLVLTEKGNLLKESLNQVVFEVAEGANKIEIKQAVQQLFKVTVLGVNTLRVRGRMRRMGRTTAKTANWKKAIVSLKKGDKIEFFEGT